MEAIEHETPRQFKCLNCPKFPYLWRKFIIVSVVIKGQITILLVMNIRGHNMCLIVFPLKIFQNNQAILSLLNSGWV